MKQSFLYLILVFTLFACANKQTQQDNSTPLSSKELSHAHGFAIDHFDGYNRIQVMDPWQKGKVLRNYYILTDNDAMVPAASGMVIAPLQNIAITSCTHIEFLNMLGELTSITGYTV